MIQGKGNFSRYKIVLTLDALVSDEIERLTQGLDHITAHYDFNGSDVTFVGYASELLVLIVRYTNHDLVDAGNIWAGREMLRRTGPTQSHS